MKAAKDYIIFALDVKSLGEAKEYVLQLSEHVGMFKVGLELFIRVGPEIINLINDVGGARVFLDLKLHDIPATVSRAIDSIADLGAEYTTIHCGDSMKMLESAVSSSRGRVGVLCVTLLTSISKEDIETGGFSPEFCSDLSKLVMKRAAMAKNAGCNGIVCSGREVKAVKKRFGNDFIAVTPGIRPSWDTISPDDQERITTPLEAVKNGADYLVIGRPIRDAKDPKEAAMNIAKEIEAVI